MLRDSYCCIQRGCVQGPEIIKLAKPAIHHKNTKNTKKKAGVVMGFVPHRNARLSVLNTCIPVSNP